MHILVVLGTRPQIIKTISVLKELKRVNKKFTLVHTGQHYDHNLSSVFYEQLGDITPDIWLKVNKTSPTTQIAEIITELDKIIKDKSPDLAIIPGDTNSALAGALACFKADVPVIHLESGLRSNDLLMQEEINRRLIDHGSSLLLCPTQTAVNNLNKENVRGKIAFVGDTMADNFNQALERLKKENSKDYLANLGLQPKSYVLLTLHRKENTDDLSRLKSILTSLDNISEKIIFPIHPRTRKVLEKKNPNLLRKLTSITLLDPLPYDDFIKLCISSKIVLTDSGGLQKEAFLMNIPCITLRDATEWTETVDLGSNIVVGANISLLKSAYQKFLTTKIKNDPTIYGDGNASKKIVEIIQKERILIPSIPKL